CTMCHENLGLHTNRALKGPGSRVYDDVTSFVLKQPGSRAGHTEFALWRGPGPARDPGTLRFNHSKHLNPAGVLVPGGAARRVLACADCHTPDPERRGMRPIQYERHCRACHPLSVALMPPVLGGDPALVAAASAFAQTPARHPRAGESPRDVRA